jgi:dimethylamine/trimethylamine dehydrogenase
MTRRDSRYDVLFEPVQIGPKVTRNRFYQVPHCNGMGHRYPRAMAEMRGVKAEGGWGVVNTEECSIHPSSDISPATLMRLWDDSDLPVHELMVEKVHEHGSLAGIQLVHGGMEMANYVTRQTPIAASAIPTAAFNHVQARAMDKSDIRAFRKWHVNAAKRAQRAGYDIVYAYAAHGIMTLLFQFMLKRYNSRSDEYGGSLENRVRLTREVITDIKDAVGDSCAIAFRFAVDELLGEEGMTLNEARDVVGTLAELPDLWDVNVSGWKNDSLPSRFGTEGAQEDYVGFVKQLTTKPVVGVGRFTSPDTMVSQIKRGVLDLIGAARPSIADPFLPYKVDNGLVDEIRECIGCNMCTSGDFLAYPMRCTQNPTMGEEWRRDWHPMKIERAASSDSVLVVGAGPTGLEATLALSNRGYNVTLAEARPELGGRVMAESSMKPLSEWRRVADHRIFMISQRANVRTFVDSELSADDVLEMGSAHVAIATGATWRDDFIGFHHRSPLPTSESANILTPDQIMAGARPDGPVTVYDDDHYYMATTIAEILATEGHDVTFVTPAGNIAHWAENTLELEHVQLRLRELGVKIICNREATQIDDGHLELACVYLGKKICVPAETIVPVTSRISRDELYRELIARREEWEAAGIRSVTPIGDCHAPATIAMGIYAGHEYARTLEKSPEEAAFFRRENGFGGE